MPANFDASEFLKGLDMALAAVKRGERRGMALMLAQTEKLAKEAVPIKSSTLGASICTDMPARFTVTDRECTGRIYAGGGEASDYSIYQHEETLHHTHPVDGTYPSKYIETPIKRLVPIFPEVMAGEILTELTK